MQAWVFGVACGILLGGWITTHQRVQSTTDSLEKCLTESERVLEGLEECVSLMEIAREVMTR